MKKLHLTFIALFVLLSAQAQTPTEKDLLGEWSPVQIEVSGLTVNLKTDEVTFSGEMKQMIEESGEDVEALKPMIVEEIKSQGLDQVKVIFKPGLKSEWTTGDEVKEFGYTIVQENGNTYLQRTDDMKMQFTLENGMLNILMDGGQTVKLGFEKKK